jgi:hypothetical protein
LRRSRFTLKLVASRDGPVNEKEYRETGVVGGGLELQAVQLRPGLGLGSRDEERIMAGPWARAGALVAAALSGPGIAAAQDLAADVVIHKAGGAPDGRFKLYRSGGAIRLEPAADGPGPARSAILIYDATRNVTYFLTPAQKAYVERPGLVGGGPLGLFAPHEDNPCAPVPQGAPELTCRQLGAERVNGRSATKWQATQTRGGRTITEYAWVDAEWHIAIQWQTEDQQMGQLANVLLGPQPAALFVVPPDYRKIPVPLRAPARP